MSIVFPDLKLGSKTAEVGNLQRFLNQHFGSPRLVVDEAFGPKTQASLREWQFDRLLLANGVFSTPDRGRAIGEGFIPFLQAKNFTPVPVSKDKTNASLFDARVSLVVIHDMEYPEIPTAAEWCAQFFAGQGGMTAPRASAHYSVDSDSVVQSVRERDVAWHAPGVNHNGIGIEHAGRAKQSREDWLDAYSRLELAMSAKLAAQICRRHAIPIRKLTPAEVKVGAKGFCGHVDATLAFATAGGHTDPGLNFPWDFYLALVSAA